MKAAVFTRYGPPDVVQIQDVDKPVPKGDEVLIQVCAASVNPLDWHLMRGEPHFIRAMTGLRRPRVPRIGVDLAGRVEAAGTNVTQFHPGDEVFGTTASRGAFAEYACAYEKDVVLKPVSLAFEQAASVPVAGLTALQGLRDKGRIQPGQKVLINGAAGGVGTFAVQIARSFRAEVTGVCSTKNMDLVRSLGADHVMDYTREDFTQGEQRYDLLFDCVGNHSLSACRRVLHRKGMHIGVGGSISSTSELLVLLIKPLVLSPFVSQRFVTFISKSRKEDLITLCELMAAGKVAPVIDRRYSLGEVPEAIRYLEEGHARGKVVITFE